MSRRSRWLKRIGIALVLSSVFVGLARTYIWHRMSEEDKRHAAFCGCCTSIKGLLSGYGNALEKSLIAGDMSPLDTFYASDYASNRRGHWHLNMPIDLGGVSQSHLIADGNECFDREMALRDARYYLQGIKKLDYVKFKIDLIEEIVPDVSAVLTIKCVVDGQDLEGQLFQDRFFFRWHIENRGSDGEAHWQILSDELVEGVRVAGNGQSFIRLETKDIGIDYKHCRNPKLDKNNPNVHLKFALIEHAAGGVSAVDFDDDGRTDLFFLDGVNSRLYKNVTPIGAATVAFEDVTVKSGLGVIDQACSAMFGDFDNDGDKDLFVSRYGAQCKLFRNQGNGHFTDATAEVGLDLVAPCVSSCLIDYDQDGFLDIYIGVNGDAFNDAPDIPFYATNGQPNRLYRNVAGKQFVDVTQETGTGSRGWTLAVTSGDYDNDGRPDLAVANDFGRKVLYHNNGNGTFSDRAKEAGVLDFSGGMGVAFADMNGDDFPDLLTSNIESGQRYFGEEITLWQFFRNEVRSGWIWHDLPIYQELYGLMGNTWRDLGKQVGEGNSVFCNLGNGKFEEWKDCHASRAGWAWSVNPFDFDNDGDMDIYVANGWVSGKKKDDL